MSCQNNLKQIGVACHNFHGVFGYFQSDNSATAPPYPYPNTCWILQTLPYLEQQNVEQAVTNGGNGSQQGNGENGERGRHRRHSSPSITATSCSNSCSAPVAAFAAMGCADYNYVQQNTAVLYGAPVGVSLANITNANGSSNTAMVAHLACNPQDYPNGPTPWYNCIQPSPPRACRTIKSRRGSIDQTFSSPHPGGNVVLFADGHVQSINNEWLTANQSIWNWQNTTPIQFP